MKYAEQFDFVTLVETFVDNTFDMSGFFFFFFFFFLFFFFFFFFVCDHVRFVCPAVKLSYQGRRSGGVIVMVKKHISKSVEELVSSAIMGLF